MTELTPRQQNYWNSRGVGEGKGVVEEGEHEVTPVKKLSSLTMLIQFKAAPKGIELQKRA